MVCNADGYDPEGGFICDESNILDSAVPHGPGSGFDCARVFTTSDFYDYEIEPVDEALRSLVMDEAGRSDAPLWCRR
ncbi:MAG TPA: hypothetical protein ENK57_01690 [Polyangiaceae bacterium]|nr:hypothetical protein [Polyangiaceae bacterium]